MYYPFISIVLIKKILVVPTSILYHNSYSEKALPYYHGNFTVTKLFICLYLLKNVPKTI